MHKKLMLATLYRIANAAVAVTGNGGDDLELLDNLDDAEAEVRALITELEAPESTAAERNILTPLPERGVV